MLAALAIVSIVAALRRSLGGAMPASTGKLSTGVARRQPLIGWKAVLRQVSSFRQWLLRSHVGAQYSAGAMTMACVAVLNVAADAPQVVPHAQAANDAVPCRHFGADVAHVLLEGQGSVQGDSEVPWVGAWRKDITIDVDDELLAGFLGVQVEWGGSCFCLAETQAPSSKKADEV